jgi:hypothetical protein
MIIDQEKSAFHEYRSRYNPRTPRVLQESFLEGVEVEAAIDASIAAIFP